MKTIINATEVRKNWGAFIDEVVRQKPAFVKRSRDVFTVLSLEQLDLLLSKYTLKVNIEKEEDSSYTGIIEELDIVTNADTIIKLQDSLAKDLIEYAEEYMNEFNLYYNSTNRKNHFPYIYKVIVHSDNLDKVKKLMKFEEKN